MRLLHRDLPTTEMLGTHLDVSQAALLYLGGTYLMIWEAVVLGRLPEVIACGSLGIQARLSGGASCMPAPNDDNAGN